MSPLSNNELRPKAFKWVAVQCCWALTSFCRWKFQEHFHEWEHINFEIVSFEYILWVIQVCISSSYMCQWVCSTLVQIMACCLFGTKPLSKPMLGYCQLDHLEQNSVKFYSKYKTFHSRKYIWKWLPFWPGPTFIKPDQRNPWIKDQLWNDLLSTMLHLQLPNFVSCGRDKPSHMTQNLVTVGVKL